VENEWHDRVDMKLSDYANFNVISHHFLEQSVKHENCDIQCPTRSKRCIYHMQIRYINSMKNMVDKATV